MCTCAVRNCLECRHRLHPSTPSTPVPSSPAATGTASKAVVPSGDNGKTASPIQSLISGQASIVRARTYISVSPCLAVERGAHRCAALTNLTHHTEMFGVMVVQNFSSQFLL